MFYASAETSQQSSLFLMDEEVMDAPHTTLRDLVVLSGDLNCLMPVIEYARTGAHLLYVLNFPAYMGVAPNTPPRRKTTPGLGFEYGEDAVLRATENGALLNAPREQVRAYRTLLNECGGSLRQCFVRVGLTLVTALFKTAAAPGARLFFRIGGVNTLNAASERSVINEAFLYAQATLDYGRMLSLLGEPPPVVRALILEPLLSGVSRDASDALRTLVATTRHVYADLSGSMASGLPLSELGDVSRLRAVVILGGTKGPPRLETESRLSCATTYPYCAPASTHALLRSLPSTTLVLTVTHDAVPYLTPHDEEALRPFLRCSGLTGGALEPLLTAYYEDAERPPPHRADGLYSARVLARLMVDGTALPTEPAFLHCDAVYGVALVSSHAHAMDAVEEYYGQPHAPQAERVTVAGLSFATLPVRNVTSGALLRLTCQ